MKSEFSYWAYFLAFYALVFTLLLSLCVLGIVIFNNVMPAYFYYIITLAVIFVWIWVVFGELRTKVIRVEIGYDTISAKRYLGWAPPNFFYFDQIDGFKTSILPARGTSYEYLYLMAGNKKVIKLSQFYHRNYLDLKQMIISEKFKDLGCEDYSSIREMKEIFI
jgi:hypothetical protein